jgi:DNA-binding NarL/FixJ family response regulator
MTRPERAATPLRVYLVHQRRLLAEAVLPRLREEPDLEVVGAARLEAAVVSLTGTDCDLVLVDGGGDGASGAETVRRLRDALPEIPILPFGLDGADAVVRCIEAGANGYVDGAASFESLVAAARAVVRGRASCTPAVASRVLERIVALSGDRRSPPPASAPTEREREVLELVADGLANKEIAARLGISLSTVKNHVHSLLDKLGVGRRRDAVRVAYQHGLIDHYLPRRGAAVRRDED